MLLVKNIFQIIFFIVLIYSSRIFPKEEFFSAHQEEKKICDTLKSVMSVQKDSTNQKISKEILKPIKSQSLLQNDSSSFVLSQKFLETIDYRFAGDLFTNVPFGFLRDLGSIGQPYETLIYGQGFGNISFLSDGISINNRLSNALDLNLVQSESIGSIEVVPLSRGFLFGSVNNSVAVNFISRQPDTRRAYSRLKFYQAPNEEGMIDGTFSINPLNKLNVKFEIANHSTDPFYDNSSYSNWSGAVGLNYHLSKSVNIIASYRHVKSEVELNGGVDADSIRERYPAWQFDKILYDKVFAPVRFTNRYQKVYLHSFNLRMLANFFENSQTELSFYNQSHLTEFRQNEYGDNKKYEIIFHDHKNSIVGGNLRHDFNFDFTRITSISNMEQVKINSPFFNERMIKSYFSTAAIASFNLLSETFIPAFFAKYLKYDNKNYIGFGGDALLKLNKTIKLYAGFSSFEKPRSIWEERFSVGYPLIKKEKQKFSAFELSASLIKTYMKAALSYFNQTSWNIFLPSVTEKDPMKTNAFYADEKKISLQGINLNLNLKLWKILLSTNTSYYFSERNRIDFKLPEFTSYGGVYYVDTLFNNNLNLKAGINYISVGQQNNIMFDFEKNISFNRYYQASAASSFFIPGTFSPTFQIDLFLAGRIQDSATIYFIFENILDKKYFIVPYYPKQPRGIRLGVAWEFLD